MSWCLTTNRILFPHFSPSLHLPSLSQKEDSLTIVNTNFPSSTLFIKEMSAAVLSEWMFLC